jgi:hypothetical protein
MAIMQKFAGNSAFQSAYSVINRVAALGGIFPTPRGIMEDLGAVVDPFFVRGQIPLGTTVPGAGPTDFTAGELFPFPALTNGVLASRGSSEAYVGYIYGLTLRARAITAELPDVVQGILSNTELVLQSGNRSRSLPFGSLARINPHLVNATADEQLQTCGAPGRPAYLLPIEVLPWTGVASCSIGYRFPVNSQAQTLIGNFNFEVEVWGVFARGTASDVTGRGCQVNSTADLLEALKQNAQMRAAVLQGGPLPAGLFGF